MQRQKLRSNPKKKFGHRNGRSSCAHSIGKFFLGYIVLFSFETSATGSPGNYLYILYCLDWIFLYRYVLTSSSPALNPCDFIPWITAQSLGTSVDPLSQIWPNNNHIKRQFTYVVLWCIHTQMLHETGIFTKPFPLECSHFSPHVSKQSIHEAFGIYDIWPNTPYTEIAYDMMWRNTLVLWYDWVVVSNIYIYRYIYIYCLCSPLFGRFPIWLDMTVTLWSYLLFIWCPSPKHGAPPIRVRCWVLWKMLASGHSLWRCSKYPWFRVRWGDIWVKYRFHYLLSLQIAVDI